MTIAVYVSFKAIEDEDFATLEEISLISGIEEEELLLMEWEFCEMMDFRVVVLADEVRGFKESLVDRDFATIEGCEGSLDSSFPKLLEEIYDIQNNAV